LLSFRWWLFLGEAMPMEVIVLAGPNSWYARDLERAAAGRFPVTVMRFSAIRSTLGPAGLAVDWQGRPIRPGTGILVRTMPPGSLEQVVFRMDALARLETAGFVVLNHAKAIEAAVDKYLALAKIQAAGLPVPPTVVCQTVEDAMEAFTTLGGDLVVKPLFGGEGRGICRVADPDIAFRTFKTLFHLDAVLYLQQYLPAKEGDLRLFVLGEEVFAMRRFNPSDWRSNVSRGGRTEPAELTPELAAMARLASQSVGAEICGVDLLTTCDNQRFILEVNAVPGWQALSRTLNIDIAARVLDYLAMRIHTTTR